VKRRTALASAAAALACVAALWEASHSAGPAQGPAVRETTATAPASAASSVRASHGSRAGTFAGAQPATADAFLAPGLRHRVDALLLEAGEARDPALLKQRLAALAQGTFTAADAQRAVELLDRYVDYRVALAKLKPPADMGDPHALRRSLDDRRRLRERHFDAAEYQALFGAEEDLDRFTLARLEIQRHTGLTPAQKEAALQEAEMSLGESHRIARAQATQHVAVAAQTEALEAQAASDPERYRQRRALLGDPAAQRLAALDHESRDWQARLAQYEAARAGSTTAELEALRQRMFSPEEQLRLDGAIALRAQGLQRK
jgi:lipase chaperone LimK